MFLQVAEAWLHTLATLFVQRGSFRRLHAQAQRFDFLLVLAAFDCSSLVRHRRALGRLGTHRAMLRRTAVLIHFDLLLLLPFLQRAADLEEAMPLRAVISFLGGIPTELVFGNLAGLLGRTG